MNRRTRWTAVRDGPPYAMDRRTRWTAVRDGPPYRPFVRYGGPSRTAVHRVRRSIAYGGPSGTAVHRVRRFIGYGGSSAMGTRHLGDGGHGGPGGERRHRPPARGGFVRRTVVPGLGRLATTAASVAAGTVGLGLGAAEPHLSLIHISEPTR